MGLLESPCNLPSEPPQQGTECLVKGQSSWTRTENSPHQCTERTGRLFLKISPIADKESRRWTNVSHAVSKFILSNRGWSFVDRGTPRENEGGTGEEVRAGGGYCRAHKAARILFFFFFFHFSSFEMHLPRSDGIHYNGRRSVFNSLSQTGNRKAERSIKAI